MRIWVVNPYDDIPGEGARQRYWTLCECLAQRGHRVTWWSSSWSHRRKQARQLATEKLSFECVLIPTPPYQNNVGIARIRNHRVFSRKLLKQGTVRIKQQASPDIVLFSWPPMESGRIALDWKEQCGCKVVMDLMDAWPDNFLMFAPVIPGARSLIRLAFANSFNEADRICQRVDAASAQSEAFAKWIDDHDGPKAHVCHLGASVVKIPHETMDTASLRLLYLGAMGAVYDLETVLRAIAFLKSNGVAVHLDMAGDGTKLERLKALTCELGLEDSVIFHGYIQGDVVKKLLSEADVGLVPMFPESLVAVPYKAGEYLAAGLSIINSLPGEMASMIQEHGCGAEYVAGDVDSLSSAIESYVRAPDRLLLERENAYALHGEYFDRSVTYERWTDWLEAHAN